MKLNKEKAIASFELIILIISIFAFSYILDSNTPTIDKETLTKVEEYREKKISVFGAVLISIVSQIKKPMIPFASAIDEPILGCCLQATNGDQCATASIENCPSTSTFINSQTCGETSFCKRGCCYNDALTVFDDGVLQTSCNQNWVDGSCSNIPTAQKGCCVIDAQTFFENSAQCTLRTTQLGFGEGGADWRSNLNEEECYWLAELPGKGACIGEGGLCRFQTGEQCQNAGGSFNEGKLCTAPELNTVCEKTTETTCVEGKDEVYFLDSCGNTANIYDSSKINDADYWRLIVNSSESCNYGDLDGNANSNSCGNCQAALGGACAPKDGSHNTDYGEFYCRDTSCTFDGEHYENGESWCEYDGQVGNGDDVVGSRHWRYSCNQGVVDISPCTDYRGEICIQSEEIEMGDGTKIPFKQGKCILNNWATCITFNSKKVEGDTGETIITDCDEAMRIISDLEDCSKDNPVKRCTNLNGVYNKTSSPPKCMVAPNSEGGCDRGTLEVINGQPKCKVIIGVDVTSEKQECTNQLSIMRDKWKDCYTDIGKSQFTGNMRLCDEEPNCRVAQVDIADSFAFDVCVPKYPIGYDVNNEASVASMKSNCKAATVECEVVYVPKTWGGCKIEANEDCLKVGFTEKMNDFCRGLGDCGGEANYIGKYTKNYDVVNAPDVGMTYINKIRALAIPTDDNFAKVENYTKIYEGMGGESTLANKLLSQGYGLAGTNYGILASGYTSSQGVMTSPGITGHIVETIVATAGGAGGGGAGLSGIGLLGAFAAIAVGALLGAALGKYLAKEMGLSPGGTLLMTIGGAMAGAGLVALYVLASIPIIGWILLIIGIILMLVSLLFQSDCDNEIVKFKCNPWKPPYGGSDCEKCNEDPQRVCSEYRCWSLGAACEFINKGTEQELCVEDDPLDVNPPVLGQDTTISNSDGTTTTPTSTGFRINMEDGGCLEPYTDLVIGLTTNEPSWCKADFEPKDFEEMAIPFDSDSFAYSHNLTINLQDPSHGQSHGLNWSTDSKLYFKCIDRHEIVSLGHYTAEYCVNQGPDGRAPHIEKITPLSGNIVKFNATEKDDIKVMTNELSTCRWDTTDKEYSLMSNEMNCNDQYLNPSSIYGYVCSTTLPTPNAENHYYFRCMDQPWLKDTDEEGDRNANTIGEEYIIRKPTKIITIDSIKPNTDYESGTRLNQINLEIVTSGGGEWHTCSYSKSGYNNMIPFFETGASRTHTQSQTLLAETHHYYIKCGDETGDFDTGETEFRIIQDTSTPQIARVWQVGGTIHFVTTETAECKYSTTGCGFNWNEGESAGSGTAHTISTAHGETYSIKCRDEFGNVPSGCSMQVRAI
ncbi:MAG: hypothetical protein NUV97_00690 [archaeon]|nr:hypothetical protein [archaeon]MCR4323346.1 hypothetical protein [Nanoarchaeota archaeon]